MASGGQVLNRLEMIEAVRRLFVADGTEEELHQLLGQLDLAAPYSNISDLIYYPDQNRTPEQIVDVALAARPILLGRPS